MGLTRGQTLRGPTSGKLARLSSMGSGVLYPNLYAWYVLAATLDVVVTHAILHYFGGSEVNRIADALIQRFGVLGMVALKYSSIVLVVTICEVVGRRERRLGRRLAIAAIMLSALPVGVGLLKVREWTNLPTTTVEVCELDEGDFMTPAAGRMGGRYVVEPDASATTGALEQGPLASW